MSSLRSPVRFRSRGQGWKELNNRVQREDSREFPGFETGRGREEMETNFRGWASSGTRQAETGSEVREGKE